MIVTDLRSGLGIPWTTILLRHAARSLAVARCDTGTWPLACRTPSTSPLLLGPLTWDGDRGPSLSLLGDSNGLLSSSSESESESWSPLWLWVLPSRTSCACCNCSIMSSILNLWLLMEFGEMAAGGGGGGGGGPLPSTSTSSRSPTAMSSTSRSPTTNTIKPFRRKHLVIWHATSPFRFTV